MTHRKRGLVAGILFLAVTLTPVAAVSRPFEDGQEAFKSGDYDTALRLWRPLAEQGFANALQNLGIMYAWGTGVPQDYVQAHMWFNLVGHTDRAGGTSYNMALPERRSAAVREELNRLGVRVSIITESLGESDTLVATDDGVRQPQNRRASIVLQ